MFNSFFLAWCEIFRGPAADFKTLLVRHECLMIPNVAAFTERGRWVSGQCVRNVQEPKFYSAVDSEWNRLQLCWSGCLSTRVSDRRSVTWITPCSPLMNNSGHVKRGFFLSLSLSLRCFFKQVCRNQNQTVFVLFPLRSSSRSSASSSKTSTSWTKAASTGWRADRSTSR